jgi:hypothetical protein
MSFDGKEVIQKINDDYITVSGIVHGIDTSRWPQYTTLYSNKAIPGEWTDKKSEATTTFIGTVIESHNTNGSTLVLPTEPSAT